MIVYDLLSTRRRRKQEVCIVLDANKESCQHEHSDSSFARVGDKPMNSFSPVVFDSLSESIRNIR